MSRIYERIPPAPRAQRPYAFYDAYPTASRHKITGHHEQENAIAAYVVGTIFRFAFAYDGDQIWLGKAWAVR